LITGANPAWAQGPVGPQHSDPTWQAAYWNNPTLFGTPVVQRAEANLDYDWGAGSPDSVLPPDGFSARWSRYLELQAGTYRFTATSDDGIRVYFDVGGLCPARQPRARGGIGRDIAILGAHLGSHIAQDQPPANAHRLDGRPGKLDRHVIGSIGSNVGDDAQHQVLGRHVRRELAVDDDAHALRHTQPDLAGCHHCRRFSPANAGAERAQGAVARRVRVAADDHHAGQGVTLLGENLVADAFPDVIEGGDPLLAHKLAHLLVLLGIGFVGGRRDVIQNDDVHVGIGHARYADFAEGFGNGRGVVVGQQLVWPHGDDLAGDGLVEARLHGQDLFSKRLAHLSSDSFVSSEFLPQRRRKQAQGPAR
jgi:hypothetical protein